MGSNNGALPAGYRYLEYEFIEVLGQGGFGITYLAVDLNLNKKVAIKEYYPREFAARDGEFTIRPAGSGADKETFKWGLDRFLDEAKALALFDDQNIISVKRLFQANGTAYLVMDYCDGRPLDEVIKQDGPLDQESILSILRPLLKSLRKIHASNLLHRDIKPANIYITQDGSPILLDFGSARQHISSHSRTVTSLATAGYAALEQYSTSSKQGPGVDIYGLAATLYRAMTVDKPQDALDRVMQDDLIPLSQRLQGKFDHQLLLGIDRGMALRPENRPTSVVSWADAIPILCGGVSSNPNGAQASRNPNKAKSKFGVNILYIFLAMGALVLLGILYLNYSQSHSSTPSPKEVAPTQLPVKVAPIKPAQSIDQKIEAPPPKIELSKYNSRLEEIDAIPSNKTTALGNGELISVKAAKEVTLAWNIVEARDPAYYPLAIKLNTEAFKLGHAEGAANLGYMYEYGFGTPVNYNQAAVWYKKAIDSRWPHSPQAEIQLARLYQNGKLGPPDRALATEYYLQALKIANNGNWLGTKEKNLKAIQDGLNRLSTQNSSPTPAPEVVSKPASSGDMVGRISRVFPYSGLSYAELRLSPGSELVIGQDVLIDGAKYRVQKTYSNLASVLRVDGQPIPANIVGVAVYRAIN